MFSVPLCFVSVDDFMIVQVFVEVLKFETTSDALDVEALLPQVVCRAALWTSASLAHTVVAGPWGSVLVTGVFPEQSYHTSSVGDVIFEGAVLRYVGRGRALAFNPAESPLVAFDFTPADGSAPHTIFAPLSEAAMHILAKQATP